MEKETCNRVKELIDELREIAQKEDKTMVLSFELDDNRVIESLDGQIIGLAHAIDRIVSENEEIQKALFLKSVISMLYKNKEEKKEKEESDGK